jgi:hypothetical protein
MEDRYSEAQVQRAFDVVRQLDAKQLESRVRAEIGAEVLGIFGALAKTSYPKASADEISKAIHLMVLSFLLRNELGQP